ncbi:MAG: aspartate-semialdehyde dehydrogenase [Corallococcus sp.]|nr:aspartate-semialdehyde dehydrogenase [Corallococcus sp.]
MKTIAVVGANGLVGEKLTQILQDKALNSEIRLFGNSSVGKRVAFRHKRVTVESCDRLLDGNVDYAMFMATEDVAKEYAPQLAKRGVICIDNSAYFRLKKDVPLVVPSVNGELIAGKKLIANPNCSTIQVVICVNALKPLKPTKLTAITYQAVSGAGKDGLQDLQSANGYGKLRSFRHPICDNVIPCIGQLRKDGSTSEERKLLDESRKILGLPRLKVNGFCARIPVTTGHGVFVNVQFKEKADVKLVKELLSNEPNVLVMDDAENGIYPMPSVIRNTKYVGVGRIYKDPSSNGINMFTAADNLLRGASYNAYEILERAAKEEGAEL